MDVGRRWLVLSSTIANLTSGFSLATVTDGAGVGEAHRDDVGVAGIDELLQALGASGLGLTVAWQPTPWARRRTRPTALSRPAAAESLKDWSPRPPTSYAMPTLMAGAAAEELAGALLLPLAAGVGAALLHAARAKRRFATMAVLDHLSHGVSFRNLFGAEAALIGTTLVLGAGSVRPSRRSCDEPLPKRNWCARPC